MKPLNYFLLGFLFGFGTVLFVLAFFINVAPEQWSLLYLNENVVSEMSAIFYAASITLFGVIFCITMFGRGQKE